MTLPIQDEYAELEISKQRKYQVRHPDREKHRRRRYDETEAGKEPRRRRNPRYHEKQKQYNSAISAEVRASLIRGAGESSVLGHPVLQA